MASSRLTNDYDLHPDEITALANSDHVIELFAKLGYDTSQATEFTPASLGLDEDTIRPHLQTIRRIAVGQIDADITIYLFEVKTLAVDLIQKIARKLRGTSNLLILTKDYDRLDFVMVDRFREGTTRLIVRPRILTVERQRPDAVALRVLKRFSFTESDEIFQWRKFREAYALARWTEPNFHNRALFSDYYLNRRVGDERLNPAWKEDVRKVGGDVKPLISKARSGFATKPEATTQTELIQPLLKMLGFEVKAGRKDGNITDQPDYTLYAPGQPDKPLAQVLAYRWNRSLDTVDSQMDGTPTDAERKTQKLDENPGALVVTLLEKAITPWVILTNGKLWRLYSATASNKITNYYEVDLEEALFGMLVDTEAAFKYWWLMFRRDAFTGFLDEVLTKSRDYAKDIGERLKDRIFRKIFGYLAAGFIVNMRQQKIADTDIDKDLVFRATMTFLYRLMFILYAESLELLPIQEGDRYGAVSLLEIKNEVADIAGALVDDADDHLRDAYEDDSTALYERIHKLCEYIDGGSPELNIPLYNGGLFSADSPEGEFLARYAIPDVYLAIGLDRLARDEDDKTFDLVFIDFKSLGVRQLGSIYEGLLEFKLRIAAEKLAVVKDGKREYYLPHKQAVKEKKKIEDEVEVGKVYIENTKQERKATGSYYTPDYIVKYIVEHTVGPVLAEKFKTLEPRLRDVQKRYRQHRDHVTARKDTQSPELFWTSDPAAMQLADDCLNIRVLDPAMGSGHFLVEVVDYISNRLIDFLNGWSENPVWALLDRTKADILKEMARQGVQINTAKLTRVVLLKRSVLKRCIYGVDLNKMAVELAKVSLWLDAFTLGAPLSFLDHHLKHGNSLIGARVNEVREVVEGKQGEHVQTTFFTGSAFEGLKQAVEAMRQVSFLSDNTVAQARQSKTSFADASRLLTPLKRALDVYTSRWFGNAPVKKGRKADTFDLTIEFLRRADTRAWLENPQAALPKTDYMDSAQVAQTAAQAAAQYRFFHWELEFPEVFFTPSKPGGQDVDLRPENGFDAVVGNPPYIPTEQIPETDKAFLAEKYAVDRKYETSVVFMERGLGLVTSMGRSGMITPTTWETGENYQRFREEIVLAQCQLAQIINLPFDVFPDAYIDTGIQIITRPDALKLQTFKALEYPKNTALFAIDPKDAGWNEIPISYIRDESGCKVYANKLQYDLRRKMQNAHFVTLDTVTESTQGIVETFYQYSDKPSKTYLLEYKNLDAYRFEVAVTETKFIDMKNSDSFYRFYTQPRILIRRIVSRGNRLMAIATKEPYVVKKDLNPFIVTLNNIDSNYLLTLINSTLLSFIYTGGSTSSLKDDFRQTTLEALRALPIRKIDFTTPAERRAQLTAEAQALYNKGEVAPLLAFTGARLAAGETDVIHDVLAFLAQQMIDRNKDKQAEVKRFLAWLEKELRIQPKADGSTGLDSLSGKTIIEGYLGDYQKGEPETSFADFFYRLEKNRTRFGVALSNIRERLQTEYEASLAKLIPIKQQLARTDALIDRIVYQLYGLTDEEIRLIEYPGLAEVAGSARTEVLKDEEIKPESDAAVDLIVEKIEPAAEQYFARVDETSIEAQLRAEIAGWDALPDKVRKYLRTGETLLVRNNIEDYSGVMIYYAKAVEALLMARWFEPFRNTHTEADVYNDQAFKPYMRREKPLTLGNVPFLLFREEVQFRAYLQGLYPKARYEALIDRAGFRAVLTPESVQKYRNGSAHTEDQAEADAKAARAWAIKILEYV